MSLMQNRIGTKCKFVFVSIFIVAIFSSVVLQTEARSTVNISVNKEGTLTATKRERSGSPSEVTTVSRVSLDGSVRSVTFYGGKDNSISNSSLSRCHCYSDHRGECFNRRTPSSCRNNSNSIPRIASCNFVSPSTNSITDFTGMRTVNLHWKTNSYTTDAVLNRPLGNDVVVTNDTRYSETLNQKAGNYSYRINVAGQDGNNSCSYSIKVNNPPQPSCIGLDADPEFVYPFFNNNTKLSWDTKWSENTMLLTPDGWKTVSPNNSNRVESLTNSFTFKLSAKNSAGEKVCTKLVQVVQPPKISLNTNLVKTGDKVLVTWNPLPKNPDGTVPGEVSPNCSFSTNLEQITPPLNPNVSGSAEVIVTGATTYGITCENSGSDSVDVRVVPIIQET